MGKFNKASIDVKWDAELKAVHVTGIGFLEGKTYRDGMERGLALLIEKKSKKWLADMTSQSVLSIADQDWTIQDWTPRAVAAGNQFAAFVVPKNILGQMALKRITSITDGKEIQMGYFDNLQEARQWLATFK